MSPSTSRAATAAGLGAVVIWSTWLGLSRLMYEQLGPLVGGGMVNLLAGSVGMAWMLRTRPARQRLAQLPRKYLLGCGGLFVLYATCLPFALALASDRQAVLVVGLINYLWPALTLIVSVPIQGTRPRAWFPLGVLLTVAGLAARWPASRPLQRGRPT